MITSKVTSKEMDRYRQNTLIDDEQEPGKYKIKWWCTILKE